MQLVYQGWTMRYSDNYQVLRLLPWYVCVWGVFYKWLFFTRQVAFTVSGSRLCVETGSVTACCHFPPTTRVRVPFFFLLQKWIFFIYSEIYITAVYFITLLCKPHIFSIHASYSLKCAQDVWWRTRFLHRARTSHRGDFSYSYKIDMAALQNTYWAILRSFC